MYEYITSMYLQLIKINLPKNIWCDIFKAFCHKKFNNWQLMTGHGAFINIFQYELFKKAPWDTWIVLQRLWMFHCVHSSVSLHSMQKINYLISQWPISKLTSRHPIAEFNNGHPFSTWLWPDLDINSHVNYKEQLLL